jgi:hypothetical protein
MLSPSPGARLRPPRRAGAGPGPRRPADGVTASTAGHGRHVRPSVSCFQIAIVHNASSATEMGKAQSRPIVRDVVTNRACDRGRRAERDDLSAHMESQPFPPTSKYSAIRRCSRDLLSNVLRSMQPPSSTIRNRPYGAATCQRAGRWKAHPIGVSRAALGSLLSPWPAEPAVEVVEDRFDGWP